MDGDSNMVFNILLLLTVPWLAAGIQPPSALGHSFFDTNTYAHPGEASQCPQWGGKSCGFSDLCEWNLDSSVLNTSSLISGEYDPFLSIVASCANSPRRDTFTFSKLPLNSCVWNHDGILDWGRQYAKLGL